MRARGELGQQAEAALACEILNAFTLLGRPESTPTLA